MTKRERLLRRAWTIIVEGRPAGYVPLRGAPTSFDEFQLWASHIENRRLVEFVAMRRPGQGRLL